MSELKVPSGNLVAKLFLKHTISAVPVLDDKDKLVGIVSEGDLLRRAEIGTKRHRSWWLLLITEDATLAADYVKAHGIAVADVMTRDVITAAPDTPLHEIATTMFPMAYSSMSAHPMTQATNSPKET